MKINDKEIAKRLRDIANNAADADVELRLLADELDPPKPEPGLVWYTPRNANNWRLGWWNGTKVRDVEEGYLMANIQDDLRIKPARILGPRQVAVDVKPVSEWNSGTNAIELWMYEINPHYPNSRTLKTITREEAERMEEPDE